MTTRHFQSEPIMPPKKGAPPLWVVSCLDCGFSHDAHGIGPDDAVQSIAGSHEPSHQLVAHKVDYGDHPLYWRI